MVCGDAVVRDQTRLGDRTADVTMVVKRSVTAWKSTGSPNACRATSKDERPKGLVKRQKRKGGNIDGSVNECVITGLASAGVPVSPFSQTGEVS